MPAFSTVPTQGLGTLTVTSNPFYSTQGIVSKISNWQAAIVKSNQGDSQIEFHLTGTRNTTIGGDSNAAVPVLNGLQIVPVIAFLQPNVKQEGAVMEYGPLNAGTYVLMHVHGAININGSEPKYTGGVFKLTYSTVNDPPTVTKLNYPEINRYIDGPSAATAYAGRSYSFDHEGGIIQLSFEDIEGHYDDNITAVGAVNTDSYIPYGAAYPVGTHDEPVSPIFALIDITNLSSVSSTTVNPVLYSPSYGYITGSTPITLYTTTPGATIYYTKTSSVGTSEPVEPATPTTASTVYTTPIVIDRPTKIKAFASKGGMSDSALTEVYYFAKSDLLT